MTLREIGTGISDWFSTSLDTVQTHGLLDWPLPFALMGTAAIIVGVVIAIRILVRFFLIFLGVVHEERNYKRGFQARYGDIPTDPAERLEWANRTGRYAPPSEKGP